MRPACFYRWDDAHENETNATVTTYLRCDTYHYSFTEKRLLLVNSWHCRLWHGHMLRYTGDQMVFTSFIGHGSDVVLSSSSDEKQSEITSPSIETNCWSNPAEDVTNMFHISRSVSNHCSTIVADVRDRCKCEVYCWMELNDRVIPSHWLFGSSWLRRIFDGLYEQFSCSFAFDDSVFSALRKSSTNNSVIAFAFESILKSVVHEEMSMRRVWRRTKCG